MSKSSTRSVMLDTARGDHIVAYRATDGHIHTAEAIRQGEVIRIV